MKGIEFADCSHVRFDSSPHCFVKPAGLKAGGDQNIACSPDTWAPTRVSQLWGIDRGKAVVTVLQAWTHDMWEADRKMSTADLPFFKGYGKADTFLITGFKSLISNQQSDDENQHEQPADQRSPQGKSPAVPDNPRPAREDVFSEPGDSTTFDPIRLDDVFSDEDDDDREGSSAYVAEAECFAAELRQAGPVVYTAWMSAIDTAATILMRRSPTLVCPTCSMQPPLPSDPTPLESPEANSAMPIEQQNHPKRILPSVETTIKHSDHAPESHPRCCDCQIPNFRARRHDRTNQPAIELGGFAIDLAERRSQDCSVQFTLVGVTTHPARQGESPADEEATPAEPDKVAPRRAVPRRELNKAERAQAKKGRKRKVYVAIQLSNKAKAELMRGIMSLLLRAEHIFGAMPISRIHGDRESALLSLESELHKMTIILTTTVGNDSSANASAESAIAVLVKVARSSLYHALKALPKDKQRKLADKLWGHAMNYAGDAQSLIEIKKYGHNDGESLRPARLRPGDTIPFFAECIYREGGRAKADRTAPVAIKANYLGAHHFIPVGSKIMSYTDEGHMVETRSTTVKAITRNYEYQFPVDVPLQPHPRPQVGQDNQWFMWMSCCKCNKFRLVPQSFGECLAELRSEFTCPLAMNDEGIFMTCATPQETPVPSSSPELGAKARKHAGLAPKKPGRKPGQKDTKPRKVYKKRETKAPESNLVGQRLATTEDFATDKERQWNADFREALLAEDHGRASFTTSHRSDPRVLAPLASYHGGPNYNPAPADSPADELPAREGQTWNPTALMSEWATTRAEEKENSRKVAAEAFARMLKCVGFTESQVRIKDPEAFNTMLDWFSSEEAIKQDQEAEQFDDPDTPKDLGHVQWEVYSAKDPAKSSVVYDFVDALHSAADDAATEHGTGKLPDPEAFVYQALKIKDAKTRTTYVETVAKEVGRMLQFQCWGKPVARSSISPAAWIYRVNMLYGIKNAELPEKAKDKARLVLMGNLRFTKSGKLMLDRWFRTPGEFWAPASSMAGLRFVAAMAVLMGLPVKTIDLDSAYLQSSVKKTGDYLELSEEVIDGLSDDWKAAIEEARREDRAAGGKGDVVFPLYKNLYGKAPSGTNFITDLQTSLIQLDWVRLPHCPGTFMKKCTATGKPMIIANYVDDFAAVMTEEGEAAEWAALAELWKFDPPRVIDRFLGIEPHYPEPGNWRHLVLQQSGYLELVVSRYEEQSKKLGKPPVPLYKCLPMEEPIWPEESYRCDATTIHRSVIGALAYAARGTRPELMKAVHTLSRRVTKWTDAAEAFLRRVLGYVKAHLNVGLVFNATGHSTDPKEWQVDVSVDASLDIPWSQSGMFVTLSPQVSELETLIPPFLPVDWSSSGQNYMKLSPGESETVALVQAARGGLRYKHSWEDICQTLAPHPLIIREDNSQAQAFVERGWSPAMMHVPRVYGINVLWVTERLREGIFKTFHEATKMQIADPLTKMTDPAVYYHRKILATFTYIAPEAALAVICDEHWRQRSVLVRRSRPKP